MVRDADGTWRPAQFDEQPHGELTHDVTINPTMATAQISDIMRSDDEPERDYYSEWMGMLATFPTAHRYSLGTSDSDLTP
jgi:hypothetical protein